MIQGFAEELFGAHKQECAASEMSGHARAGFASGTRDAEIGEAHLAVVVHQDVCGFHVAMQDALFMRVIQRAAELLDPGHYLVQLKRRIALVQFVGHIVATDKLHGDEAMAIDVPE